MKISKLQLHCILEEEGFIAGIIRTDQVYRYKRVESKEAITIVSFFLKR